MRADRAWQAIARRGAAVVRRARLAAGLRHIGGPARFDLGPDDVVVVALVRDGAYYLDGFLRHHRAIGARHFVFIDNGSTDATLVRLVRQPDCAVLQSHLPWGAFENDLRRAAAERFARGHWCLFADMDEMLEVPDLPGLVAVLRKGGHTGLVAQMIEMFPDAPLSQVAHLPYDAVLDRFDHCDTGAVTRHDYHDPAIGFSWFLAQNTLADPGTPVLFGGVRGRVFGETCCLTKHPLVFVGDGVVASVHPHCSTGLRCAPFTVAIRHYKFANDPAGRDARTVAAAAIPHGEDALRLTRMRQGDVTLMGPGARRYGGDALLRDAGFLTGTAP